MTPESNAPTTTSCLVGQTIVVRPAAFDHLLRVLAQQGYTLVGPTVRDGAIVYDEIRSADDLPAGWTDVQGSGSYRLRRRADGALFGYTVGPHSWKRFFHVPAVTLWKARRGGGVFEVADDESPPPQKLALIGARSCELHAVAIQDRVLAGGERPDPNYVSRRRNAFVVAVNCTQAGGTCFCASMGTGPRAAGGFDLAVTELTGPGRHEFLMEIGTEAGAAVAGCLEHEAASSAQRREAEELVAQTGRRMGRRLDTDGIRDLLYRNLEHPRWQEVAKRCLACTNCTMVCPTCFCTDLEDVTDLAGTVARRVRVWDSCFTLSFSYIVGGSVRRSVASRYRHWLTHKLATWIDQFGTPGCVGCGRCITWCPAGIDLTQEVAAIRETDSRGATESPGGPTRWTRSNDC